MNIATSLPCWLNNHWQIKRCMYLLYALVLEEKRKGIAQEWHKAAKRIVNVCAYCSSIDSFNRTHYLCKDHFVTFHGAK
eukprot:3599906-Ditylum_brightwellii.AAC.1